MVASSRLAGLLMAMLGAAILPVGTPPPPAASNVAARCDPLEGPDLQPRFEAIGGVGTGNGRFAYDSADLIVGPGMSGAFKRSYFSGSELRDSSLGRGFASLFDARLRIDANRTTDMLFFLPGRGAERFAGAAERGSGTGRNRAYRKLERQPDSTWVVHDAEVTWSFGSVGELLGARTVDGDLLRLVYDGWQFVEAEGPIGPTLAIEWQSDLVARVRDLTDPHRFVDYRYDNHRRLASVATATGSGERFTYDGDSHRLAEIADGSGHVLLRLEYDQMGRVVREIDADGLRDGQAVTYEYIERQAGAIETIVRYPQSRIEPDWRPFERHLADARGYTVEIDAYPTSSIVARGRYRAGPDGQRQIVENPCDGLLLIPQAGSPKAPPSLLDRGLLLFVGTLLRMHGLAFR